jgi:hypothetical protein
MPQTSNQSTTIDGVTYTVYMLDPLEANDLMIDIGHVIGPSLGAIVAALKGNDTESILDAEPDPELLKEAISGLFQRIEKRKMREIISMLARMTEVNIDGKSPRLDSILAMHFQGRLGKLYEWLWFAMKVQLGDFFDSAKPAISRGVQLAGAAVSPSQSSQSITTELAE